MIGHSIAIHALTLLQQTVPSGPGAMTPEQIQQIAQEAMRHRPPIEGVLVPLAFFAFLAFSVWQRTLSRRRRAQAQADLQKKLLDKFTSGPELATFLESPGGQRFLTQLHAEGTDAESPDRARSLRTGIIVLAVGAALLILKARLAGVDPHEQTGFLIGGVILFALGIGFLISAAISHRLTKQWDGGQKTGGPAGPIS